MGRPPKNKENKQEEVLKKPFMDESDGDVATMEQPDKEATVTPEQPVPVGMERVEAGDYKAVVTTDFERMVDPFTLSQKDPNFEYRFLYMEQKNLSMKTSTELGDKGGWMICPPEHLEKMGIPKDMRNDKNQFQKGDTILAFMPKDLFIKKQKYKQEKANAPTDAVQRMLSKGDPREGGKEIHDSMKGIQTGKSLRM